MEESVHYSSNVKKNTISHRMDEMVLNAHSLRNSQKALTNALIRAKLDIATR